MVAAFPANRHQRSSAPAPLVRAAFVQTAAALNDTCGNLIQITQLAR
jgi:hypothetical protein